MSQSGSGAGGGGACCCCPGATSYTVTISAAGYADCPEFLDFLQATADYYRRPVVFSETVDGHMRIVAVEPASPEEPLVSHFPAPEPEQDSPSLDTSDRYPGDRKLRRCKPPFRIVERRKDKAPVWERWNAETGEWRKYSHAQALAIARQEFGA